MTIKSLLLAALLTAAPVASWAADGTSSVASSPQVFNPMMWADVPDPDVIRVGKYYYLVSTTMHLMPGAPVMRSTDLVNWETVSYLFDNLHDTPKYDLQGGTVYGKGQWATSLRYKDGTFYAYFSPNDAPYRGYLYTTDDPVKGWTLHSRLPHFHDASLFFDDDGRYYVFSGTGQLNELNADLTDIKKDGINKTVFERDASETGLLEGSRVVKKDGMYYLIMISWPKDGKRRQVCYRASNIAGPYEKQVILEDNFAGFGYVGQGTVVDDAEGNWHGVIFQDRGGVGRVLTTMPCHWMGGWPMLGDQDGRVPHDIPGKRSTEEKYQLTVSDEFNAETLKHNWQWNHNPINKAWSLKEKRGVLRLKTSRTAQNLYMAPNTISQRLEGPACTATVALDLSHMKNGDMAGLAAFNGHTGMLAIHQKNGKRTLAMQTNVVNFREPEHSVESVDEETLEQVELKGKMVYLRLTADFRLGQDIARFYYSTDGERWTRLGSDYKMRFDFTRLFMGTRAAIFNYATERVGGYVDVDWFHYEKETE